MSTLDTASKEELIEEVKRHTWVHSIDLGGGIVTPGKWGGPSSLIMKAFEEVDFRHKKVLDIGCWDGMWSFEAERRGAAEVYATDYTSQRSYRDSPTFLLAHRILNSRARYYPDVSVYDVEQLGVRDFDVVLFCGVYYHLKHPLLALARLRQVMREGGILIVEGEALAGPDESFARFHYRNWHKQDPSNWWVPTIPCLREWIECSFFEVIREIRPGEPAGQVVRESTGGRLWRAIKERRLWRAVKRRLARRARPVTDGATRHLIVARAVRRKDPNYVFPDEDFAQCDLTRYTTENRLHGPTGEE